MAKRIYLNSLIICLAALILTGSALAAPPEQQVRAEITSPRMNAVVRGRVQILGSAQHHDFQFYKIEYGSAAARGQWSIIGDVHPNQVSDGVLAVWDTLSVPDGTYSLRLQVVDNTGNYKEYNVTGIVVANTQPTPTPTATPTSTPTATPATPTSERTPMLTPTVVVGKPTPTEEVVSLLSTPTSTPRSAPTPTPSPGALATPGRLPLNPSSMGRAFLLGTLMSGALFAIIGLFMLVRRAIG